MNDKSKTNAASTEKKPAPKADRSNDPRQNLSDTQLENVSGGALDPSSPPWRR
jgi:hypothetical protein